VKKLAAQQMRKQMRYLAVQKATQIQDILNRKEMFEKSWLVLISFTKVMKVLRKQFNKKKHDIAMDRYRNKMADRIKKAFRAYYPLPVMWRTRRFARVYAVHFSNNFAFY
jgi:hypothetical protein